MVNDLLITQADVTFVITCYNRPEELRETLKHLETIDLSALKKIIIIEDSPNPDIAAIAGTSVSGIPVQFLQNQQNVGQTVSVDRAYAEIDTPYIFHCEEDWLFPSSLFIKESKLILESDPKIHSVMVRDPSEYSWYFYTLPKKSIKGFEYWVSEIRANRKWGAFSFNPGLRRLSDYKKHGPYAKFDAEQDLAFFHKLQGYKLAVLAHGDVTHFGHASTPKANERRRRQSPLFFLKSFKRRIQWFLFKHSDKSKN